MGTEVELYLIDHQGQRQVLIPTFVIDAAERGQNDWERFPSELSASTGLAIEEEMDG